MHFKNIGVDHIVKLKRALLDKDISENELDAVLGGMLRLIHSFKIDTSMQINPRIETYFLDRLKLNKKQLGHLIYLSEKIVSSEY